MCACVSLSVIRRNSNYTPIVLCVVQCYKGRRFLNDFPRSFPVCQATIRQMRESVFTDVLV